MEISRKHLEMIKQALRRYILTMKYPRRGYMAEGAPGTLEEYEQLAEMIDDLILKQ